MNYQDFNNVFHKIIFNRSKKNLIEKIAKTPERYTGLFRPTKPKTKIIQNLTQSNEIRFGDAFEQIIEKYLIQEQYEILNKTMVFETETLVLDQIAKKNGIIIFVEQKIRDDHDSSKKRGQISNFEKKIQCLKRKYQNQTLTGFFYFIDPSLTKNKKYYIKELEKLSKKYKIELQLVYSREFFDKLGLNKIWTEINNHLSQWKKDLPDLPNINFDSEAESTFQEIKDINKNIFKKFFNNEKIIEEIWPVLFPRKKVLKLLQQYFKSKKGFDYDQFAQKIDNYTKS